MHIYKKVAMKNLVELSIKDFRAIKRADIVLDGISVVSGVNGCGKSTMSKLLYYIFRNANSFDELVLESTKMQLRPYLNVLEQIQSSLFYSNKESRAYYRKFHYVNFELTSFEESSRFIEAMKELCDKFIEPSTISEAKGDSLISNRLRYIMSSTLRVPYDTDVKKMIDNLIGRISDHIGKAEKSKIERPYRFLKESLDSAFDVTLTKGGIALKEYGDIVAGDGVVNVPLLHYIKKVAYIDTPMVIGMETSENQPQYWSELNELLKRPPRRGYKRSLNNIIKEQIINGDTSFDSDDFTGSFRYKRNDGKEFDLTECATGIKSFALLQLLLKNLFLDDTTLLIIDEPEAHLHPQWIIEYARLIVLLHKKVGVKFFIASHSTDMVSAIRAISEKEKCLSSVSFYVAEEDSQKKDTFSFSSLGNDIEPIFESFNKSFTKLDLYGG